MKMIALPVVVLFADALDPIATGLYLRAGLALVLLALGWIMIFEDVLVEKHLETLASLGVLPERFVPSTQSVRRAGTFFLLLCVPCMAWLCWYGRGVMQPKPMAAGNPFERTMNSPPTRGRQVMGPVDLAGAQIPGTVRQAAQPESTPRGSVPRMGQGAQASASNHMNLQFAPRR